MMLFLMNLFFVLCAYLCLFGYPYIPLGTLVYSSMATTSAFLVWTLFLCRISTIQQAVNYCDRKVNTPLL
jgi:hypothetical protein